MKVPSIGSFSSSLNPSSAVDNPASPTSASSDENNLDDFSRESSIIENIDQFEYSSLLEEANSSSYPDLENSHCVQLGYDPSSSHPIILLIPELGLNKIQPMTLQLHRLVLYFLKMIQHIVIHRYILIYCHTPLSILSQTTLIQQFHKILPTSHRKNISKLIVLHPTFMIKLFFDTAGSWFLSKKFYRKLVFYETIRDFQLHNPSFQIQFPSTFHRNEDHNLGYKPASYLPPLQRFFVKSLGTTKLLYRCIEYLRKINGSQSKGLFRIAGDRVIEDLVKTRLCLMPNDWEDYIIIGDKEVKGSPLIIESSPTMPNSIPIHQRASSQSLSTVPTPIPPSHQRSISLPQIPSSTQSPLSCLHITDIDCICGILKMSIRDLPEPLISYGHYDYLTDLTRRLESGQLDRTSWEEQVNRAIGTLPHENNATLKYLLG